jgi:heme/copper-type cytochrome/quinol oxidase subunit 4
MFFKPASLPQVLIFAAFLLIMEALLMNIVFLSWFVGIFQVVVGLPLFLFLKRDDQRQRLRNITILLGVVVMVVVLVKVNAYVAPLRANQLIAAIESYRAENGVYPKALDDLVPKFIDHVPRAQYTLDGTFHYMDGGTAKPPMLWYNPHQMDHRGYHFGTKDWFYLG